MIYKAVALCLAFLLCINIASVPLLKCFYEANKPYFTRNFCVNKDKPAMKCDGKCHLNKTIKKLNQADSEAKESMAIHIASEYLINSSTEVIKGLSGILTIRFSDLFFGYEFDFSASIPKPPSFI